MAVAVESYSSNSHCCCASTSYGCSNHVISSSSNSKSKSNEECHNATSMCALGNNKYVVLVTAIVQLKEKSGKYYPARALLDSGSQVNLISEDICQKLRLNKENGDLNIVGVGNNSKKITKSVSTVVK